MRQLLSVGRVSVLDGSSDMAWRDSGSKSRVGGWWTPVARIGGGETSQRREETEREEKGDTVDVDKSVMSGALRRAV